MGLAPSFRDCALCWQAAKGRSEKKAKHRKKEKHRHEQRHEGGHKRKHGDSAANDEEPKRKAPRNAPLTGGGPPPGLHYGAEPIPVRVQNHVQAPKDWSKGPKQGHIRF